MNTRLKRFLAMIAVLAFVTAWVWGAVSLAAYLPDSWWIQLIFYAVAGIGWGVPLVPFLRWADKG
jgi:hypothetical protein